MDSMTQDEHRAAYIVGLVALADALAADPSIPLPHYGASAYPFTLNIQLCSTREQFAAVVDLLTDVREWVDGHYYRAEGKLAGLHVEASIAASTVGRTVRREVETFEVEPFAVTA